MSLCIVPTSLLQKLRLREVQSWLEATQSYSAKISGRDEPEPLFLKPWSGVCPPTPVPKLLPLLGARMCEQVHRRASEPPELFISRCETPRGTERPQHRKLLFPTSRSPERPVLPASPPLFLSPKRGRGSVGTSHPLQQFLNFPEIRLIGVLTKIQSPVDEVKQKNTARSHFYGESKKTHQTPQNRDRIWGCRR